MFGLCVIGGRKKRTYYLSRMSVCAETVCSEPFSSKQSFSLLVPTPSTCCQRKQTAEPVALESSIIWQRRSLSVGWTNAFGVSDGSLVTFKLHRQCGARLVVLAASLSAFILTEDQWGVFMDPNNMFNPGELINQLGLNKSILVKCQDYLIYFLCFFLYLFKYLGFGLLFGQNKIFKGVTLDSQNSP